MRSLYRITPNIYKRRKKIPNTSFVDNTLCEHDLKKPQKPQITSNEPANKIDKPVISNGKKKGDANIEINDENSDEILHNMNNFQRKPYSPTAFLLSKWN